MPCGQEDVQRQSVCPSRAPLEKHLFANFFFPLWLLHCCASENSQGQSIEPVTVKGVWVLSAEGKPFPPGKFKRGLQPSGLAFRKGELWSIGDQRSEFPGTLFRIDPGTGRLLGLPVPLELPARAGGERKDFAEFRGIPGGNPDFEGLALVPGNPNRFVAITEDKTSWVVDIRIEESGSGHRARIAQLTRISFPAELKSWREDSNYRFEGCAVSDDSKTLYLAFERTEDELPRVYQAPLELACSGTPLEIKEIPLPFAAVPRRAGKEQARLNLNDIQFFRLNGRCALVAVLRDQERLCILDLERNDIPRIVDLNLIDPQGERLEWASPEGVALDPATGRLWIVNDPDSVGTNYRARKDAQPAGEYANYSPLLFELGDGCLVKP